MSTPDDGAACRQRARAFLDTPEGDAVLLAIERVREALQRETQANSDEARDDAQADALEASAAFDEAMGIASLRRWRMLAAIDSAPPRVGVSAREHHRRVRKLVRNDSPAARIKLRRMLGRCVYDCSETVGDDLANHLAGHLLQTKAGRDGIMAVEKAQGVDPETGAAVMLRLKIIGDTGYTVGFRVPGERVPSAYWVQAARNYNTLAAKLRAKGEKVPAVTASTIRDWCSREGEGRDLFEAARADGRRDRAEGRKASHRLLS